MKCHKIPGFLLLQGPQSLSVKGPAVPGRTVNTTPLCGPYSVFSEMEGDVLQVEDRVPCSSPAQVLAPALEGIRPIVQLSTWQPSSGPLTLAPPSSASWSLSSQFLCAYLGNQKYCSQMIFICFYANLEALWCCSWRHGLCSQIFWVWVLSPSLTSCISLTKLLNLSASISSFVK